MSEQCFKAITNIDKILIPFKMIHSYHHIMMNFKDNVITLHKFCFSVTATELFESLVSMRVI